MNRMFLPVVVGIPLLGLVLLVYSFVTSYMYAAEVSGTVTVDGKPLESGTIVFAPRDGKSASVGGIIKDGKFMVPTTAGAKEVSISAPKVIGKKKILDKPDSPEIDVVVETLPPRCNTKTELIVEIKPGKNQTDFILRSK